VKFFFLVNSFSDIDYYNRINTMLGDLNVHGKKKSLKRKKNKGLKHFQIWDVKCGYINYLFFIICDICRQFIFHFISASFMAFICFCLKKLFSFKKHFRNKVKASKKLKHKRRCSKNMMLAFFFLKQFKYFLLTLLCPQKLTYEREAYHS